MKNEVHARAHIQFNTRAVDGDIADTPDGYTLGYLADARTLDGYTLGCFADVYIAVARTAGGPRVAVGNVAVGYVSAPAAAEYTHWQDHKGEPMGLSNWRMLS